jgi:di/tricarboxylate transporter
VPEGGPAAGLAPAELARRAGATVRVLQHVRGEEVLAGSETAMEAGDLLVLRGEAPGIVALLKDLRLEPLEAAPPGEAPPPHAATFAELVVTPASEIVGDTLAELGLHRRYGVVATALLRRGAHLRHGFARVALRPADVILVQGTPEAVEQLRHEPGFLLLLGAADHVPLRRRAPAALAILGGFIALAATGAVDLALLAVAAALACFLTGSLTPRRALREVDWNVLGLLAGSITLGAALEETGVATLAAHHLVAATRDLGPIVVLSAVYFLAMAMTEFVSNAGAAALAVPIALAAAAEMQVSPRPFVFAVAFAASASFSTPVGYQTNAFVYGPGGYRFSDFLRVGLPLQVLLWAYATVALPLFWGF